jgi:hypothetical protein
LIVRIRTITTIQRDPLWIIQSGSFLVLDPFFCLYLGISSGGDLLMARKKKKPITTQIREMYEESDTECSSRIQAMLDEMDEDRIRASRSSSRVNNDKGRGYVNGSTSDERRR